MAMLSYDGAPFAVRVELEAAHQRVWDRLARAGTWLDGPTRIRVAAETRHAPGCALCARRKAALSPYAVEGTHDGRGELPGNWIEMIHRIVADPGRLTHAWYRRMLTSGIADTEYVEIVSVIAHVTAIDTFAYGLGIPVQPLPAPLPGAPSRYRPAEARQNEAWAPNIAWDEHGPNEADYFAGRPANIRRALTLVPDEARSFFDLVGHQYLPGPAMRDFGREYRAITHAQIELLAGRISAINQCVY
jgi:alkylhydroperoxidase family enzyme